MEEELRRLPFKIFIKTHNRYDILLPKLTIKIEVVNKEEKLILYWLTGLPKDKDSHKGRIEFGETKKDMGKYGRYFYCDIMDNFAFGKVWIISNDKVIKEFNNYDNFIESIVD